MRLRVSPQICERYPALRISHVTIRGMDNQGADEALLSEQRAAEERFRARYADAARLGEDERIKAWREVYQSFKVNPSRFRPSAEAFLRRVVRGDAMPFISKAVNAYLLSEMEGLLPVGGYDLGRVEGDVELRHSPGGEPFTPIGAAEPERTDAGEVVYADDRRVLTRRWNYRDCDHAKITKASRDIALFVEAPLPSLRTEDIQAQVRLIADRVTRACGGAAAVGLLDVRERREVEL